MTIVLASPAGRNPTSAKTATNAGPGDHDEGPIGKTRAVFVILHHNSDRFGHEVNGIANGIDDRRSRESEILMYRWGVGTCGQGGLLCIGKMEEEPLGERAILSRGGRTTFFLYGRGASSR
jgi:hypothetical protein